MLEGTPVNGSDITTAMQTLFQQAVATARLAK
jgi:hypothetical protein